MHTTIFPSVYYTLITPSTCIYDLELQLQLLYYSAVCELRYVDAIPNNYAVAFSEDGAPIDVRGAPCVLHVYGRACKQEPAICGSAAISCGWQLEPQQNYL